MNTPRAASNVDVHARHTPCHSSVALPAVDTAPAAAVRVRHTASARCCWGSVVSLMSRCRRRNTAVQVSAMTASLAEFDHVWCTTYTQNHCETQSNQQGVG